MSSIKKFENRTLKSDFFKGVAMAQKELIDYFQGDGDKNAFRHCSKFIGMAMRLMSDYDEDDKRTVPDTETVDIDSILEELKSWQAQDDRRCVLTICGWRDQGGKMQRAALILGSKHNMQEVIRNEYDDPDKIFASRLEEAEITSKKNDNKK